jgi:hypothetical protein
MNAASLIVILLGNQGYWFGGQAGEISVQWIERAKMPDAVLVWQLMAADVRLADGRVAMAAEGVTKLQITVPQVRARTQMRWLYQLRDKQGKELSPGEQRLNVYPVDLLEPTKKQLAEKRILAWDRTGTLSGVLEKANIRHTRIRQVNELRLARADFILVGADEIPNELFAQDPLLDHAQAGAGVGIFLQSRPTSLAGYAVRLRAAPEHFDWRREHPLLLQFSPEDLRAWIAPGKQLPAIALPADEPALEIAWWPREAPSKEPVPIDALIVSKTLGKGRVVLCQLPLGPWATDPRSQQMLANVLNYLTTRPEPTPPPSERRNVPVSASQPVPTITIPPGGVP